LDIEQIPFPFHLITDKKLEEIIALANGNIDVVLKSINSCLIHDKINSEDLNLYLPIYIEQELARKKEIDKMYPTKKLYL